MAEQIISPGVFTNESVPVTTEAPVVPVGAALIGPTVLGPVGIPTVCTTYSDYKSKFGGTFVSGGVARNYFTNIAAYNYFQQGGQRLLVTRVVSGSTDNWRAATSSALITGSSTIGNLPSGLGGDVFVLQTISEGDKMNTGDTESSGNTLPTGTKDNVRWEISQADTSSGTFTLTIRQGNDRHTDKIVLETFRQVDLDPRSPNFISKRVGSQIKSVAGNASEGYYISVTGQYPNKSKYVVVKQVNLTTPDFLDDDGNIRVTGSEFKIPGNQSGSFGNAIGSIYFGTGGTGTKYNENIVEGNTQGLRGDDYEAAIDLLKNKDEFPYNVLFAPGLIYQNNTGTGTSSHREQLDAIITNLTARGDAILPLDLVKYNQPTSVVTAQAGLLNTSYAASYWPWVKVRDEELAKNVWVPASTIIPSVYVFNDNTSEAWFAPAGFTRGAMPRVVGPERTLPRATRDTLYNAKVNPIATFPNTGVVVYGQKTLQTKASATDRVNVRRLLIALKQFISNVAQNLVFEPNSLATRNSFLAVVNPYLETVQQKQGLYAFKVVMDATNNGPDVIDRNELRGAIYLQPVKTAEFIILDFNVLPTGAEFPA